MPDPWFLISFGSAVLASLGIGIWRHRLFRYKERLHHQLAADLGLQVVYTREDSFRIFGHIKGYHLSVYPVVLRDAKGKPTQPAIQLSIPMTNPQRKGWRVLKSHPDYPAYAQLGQPNRPMRVAQELPGLEISSNDLLFSSVVLSDDLKINIHNLFKQLPAAVLFIEDETLACYLPGHAVRPEVCQWVKEAAAILVDIKEELRFGATSV